MTTPAQIPPSRPVASAPMHAKADPRQESKTQEPRAAQESKAGHTVKRPETIELEMPSVSVGYRKAMWAFVVLLLLGAGGTALFVSQVHQPLAAQVEGLRGAVAERDEARAELGEVSAERDALRAERDALRTERDELRARESELSTAVAERDAQIGELQAMTESLREQLREEIAAGDVTVEERDGRIAVRLADQILFPAGRAELSARGQAVLRRVATSLRRMEDRWVQVEGHTDSTPIAGEAAERFATNWELSAARATNVVRFLAESCEIPGERLIAAGRGEFHPVADNGTAAGRRRNRRIELTLQRAPRS